MNTFENMDWSDSFVQESPNISERIQEKAKEIAQPPLVRPPGSADVERQGQAARTSIVKQTTANDMNTKAAFASITSGLTSQYGQNYKVFADGRQDAAMSAFPGVKAVAGMMPWMIPANLYVKARKNDVALRVQLSLIEGPFLLAMQHQARNVYASLVFPFGNQIQEGKKKYSVFTFIALTSAGEVTNAEAHQELLAVLNGNKDAWKACQMFLATNPSFLSPEDRSQFYCTSRGFSELLLGRGPLPVGTQIQ